MAKKEPSLDGMIQTKGASRPEGIQQRGPEPAPVAPVPAERKHVRSTPEPKAKSLTLRLSESQYQRLRRFAFDRGLSHQDVLERALVEHIDREGN